MTRPGRRLFRIALRVAGTRQSDSKAAADRKIGRGLVHLMAPDGNDRWSVSLYLRALISEAGCRGAVRRPLLLAASAFTFSLDRGRE